MDKCFECGDAAQANHHVVPKVLGGTQTIPLCLKCHGKVHNKDLVTMRKLYNNFLQKNPLKAGSYFKGGKRPYGFDVVDKILLENVEEQLVIERMMKELKEGKKMTTRRYALDMHKNKIFIVIQNTRFIYYVPKH